jgi:hypothetical protein
MVDCNVAIGEIDSALAAKPVAEPRQIGTSDKDAEAMGFDRETYEDIMDSGERALAAKPHGIPEGWKLVPVKPTDEMMDAGRGIDGSWTAGNVWALMVAAAPEPHCSEPK